jgi:hypothetical protein
MSIDFSVRMCVKSGDFLLRLSGVFSPATSHFEIPSPVFKIPIARHTTMLGCDLQWRLRSRNRLMG